MKIWLRRLYIPAMLLVITLGVLNVLFFGYEKRPAKVMTPSSFETPEELGVVLFKRFYAELKDQSLVVFGVPPQPVWHQEILRGFIKAAAFEKQPFDAVISETQMPALNIDGLPELQLASVPTNTSSQREFLEALQTFTSQGKRVLIYLPSVFSTHSLKNNVVSKLEERLGAPIFSITSGPLALRPDQEYLIDPPCLGSERDSNGTSQLGCLLLSSGRSYYRKQVKQDRWVAIMNSPRPKDYLLMVSVPGQDVGNAAANHQLRMAPPKTSTGSSRE